MFGQHLSDTALAYLHILQPCLWEVTWDPAAGLGLPPPGEEQQEDELEGQKEAAGEQGSNWPGREELEEQEQEKKKQEKDEEQDEQEEELEEQEHEELEEQEQKQEEQE